MVGRWWAWSPALLLLVAGCASQAPGQAPGQPPAVPDPGPEAPFQDPLPPWLSPGTGSGEAKEPVTWFLHVQITCNDEDPLCNCGSIERFMDASDTEGDCDSHGSTVLLQGAADDGCQCFPLRGDHLAYRAGATMEGQVYLTNDGVDLHRVTALLLADGVEVGQGASEEKIVQGLGGYAFERFPVKFQTEAPVPADAALELRLTVEAKAAYFIGYDGDHASAFTLKP